MPMPPPKASTEGPRDRRVKREIDQLVRALRAEGPLTMEELSRTVGASYWDPGRFDLALAFAVADGHVFKTDDDRLAAA